MFRTSKLCVETIKKNYNDVQKRAFISEIQYKDLFTRTILSKTSITSKVMIPSPWFFFQKMRNKIFLEYRGGQGAVVVAEVGEISVWKGKLVPRDLLTHRKHLTDFHIKVSLKYIFSHIFPHFYFFPSSLLLAASPLSALNLQLYGFLICHVQ